VLLIAIAIAIAIVCGLASLVFSFRHLLVRY
jgi:hypothetical protein